MRRGKIAPVPQANPLKIRIFLVLGAVASWVLAASVPFTATAAQSPPIASGPEAGVPADYRIGPGDTLKVYVFQNEELSTTVPVRPDGKISTPLVEDMVAVGKSPSQLARDIEKS